MFSRRTGRARAPNRIAELVAQAHASGTALDDLTTSNPTTAGIEYPPELLEALERAQSPSLVYRPEPFGFLPARQALARQLAATRGVGYHARDILLTASTSEAYALLFKLLCDPGDQILVPAPSYPLFEQLAELEGVGVVPYRLAYDGAWHLDLDSVRRAVSARTRAVVLVSPNNPTGQYVSLAESAALAELGLPLISDQVFFEYPLEGRAPPAAALETLQFSLGGLSKFSGLPQLKLAWTALSGPEPLVREARERLELVCDTFLSVATPVQHALPDLLELSPRTQAAISARCRYNLAVLQRAVAGSPVSVLRAEAGWSAVLRFARFVSEDELVTGLLREQRVLVQPGWFYDFESESYAVLSLLTPAAMFEAGAKRLVDYATRLSA